MTAKIMKKRSPRPRCVLPRPDHSTSASAIMLSAEERKQHESRGARVSRRHFLVRYTRTCNPTGKLGIYPSRTFTKTGFNTYSVKNAHAPPSALVEISFQRKVRVKLERNLCKLGNFSSTSSEHGLLNL